MIEEQRDHACDKAECAGQYQHQPQVVQAFYGHCCRGVVGIDTAHVVSQYADERAERHTDLADESLHREADTFGSFARLPFQVFDRVADHRIAHDVCDTLGDTYYYHTDNCHDQSCGAVFAAADKLTVFKVPHEQHQYHCRGAKDMGTDKGPFFSKLFGQPRAEYRGDQSAGYYQHRQYRISRFRSQGIFTKIQAAGICINHSGTAQNTGQHYQHNLVVFKQQLQILSQRTLFFAAGDGAESFFRVLESDIEQRNGDNNQHDSHYEIRPLQSFHVLIGILSYQQSVPVPVFCGYRVGEDRNEQGNYAGAGGAHQTDYRQNVSALRSVVRHRGRQSPIRDVGYRVRDRPYHIYQTASQKAAHIARIYGQEAQYRQNADRNGHP